MKKSVLSALLLSLALLCACASTGAEGMVPPAAGGNTSGNTAGGAEPPSQNGGITPGKKEIEFQIEGDTETMLLTRYDGDGWSMYYDAENFTASEEAENPGAILFSYDKDTGGASRKVWMRVSFRDGMTAAEQAESDIGDAAEIEDKTLNGVDAKYAHISSGTNPDGEIYDIYYVDADGGSYCIIVSYFLEAAEGWGARLNAMANTFEA